MRDFNNKFPGLNEEQLRIKRKIWEREKEIEKNLLESLKKKIPFSYKEGDEDTGDWAVADFGSSTSHGFVSDAAISGALVKFIYADGTTKTTTTDGEGGFDTPSDFKEGDIIVSGGTDIVTGVPYRGEFTIDAEFFYRYKSITPLTHLINHVWINTDTQTPEEALDLVLLHIFEFTKIAIPLSNKEDIFNLDPVRLAFQGINGAKEVQAINTFIEIHTELMGSTEALYKEEIEENKKKAYNKLSNALLDKIKGISTDSIMDVNSMDVDDKYKDCFSVLLNKASDMICEHLEKDYFEATKNIQALNLAIKDEWINKTLEMTAKEDIDSSNIWEEIENKSSENLLSRINVPS